MAWLRGMDLNHRPLGYEPNELPDCSTPHSKFSVYRERASMFAVVFVVFLLQRRTAAKLRQAVRMADGKTYEVRMPNPA